MSPDEYVEMVLARHAVASGPTSPVMMAGIAIAPTLREWAGPYLSALFFSGSCAKGTAVSGRTDLESWRRRVWDPRQIEPRRIRPEHAQCVPSVGVKPLDSDGSSGCCGFSGFGGGGSRTRVREYDTAGIYMRVLFC